VEASLPYELSPRKDARYLGGLQMSTEPQIQFAAAVEALVSDEATHHLMAAAVGAIRFAHPDVMTVDFEVHPRPTYVFARAEITLRGPGGWVWNALSTPELAVEKSTKAVWDHLVTAAAALPLPFADPAQVAWDPTVGVDHDVHRRAPGAWRRATTCWPRWPTCCRPTTGGGTGTARLGTAGRTSCRRWWCLTAHLHECQLSGMINVLADSACFAADSDLDFSPR
jgi:hypothetical protein